MQKKQLYSPGIDELIQHFSSSGFGNYGSDQNSFQSDKIAEILLKLFNLLQPVKPEKDGKDLIWSFWLRSERGPLAVYCSDAEYQELKEAGDIASQAELESLWNSYYPEEIQWRKTVLVQYERQFFISFDSKFQLRFDLDSHEISGVSFREKELIKFFSWLLINVNHEVTAFLSDPEAYNRFIAEHLPFRKRLGKIKRIKLWENIKDGIRLDEELGKANLERFEQAVNSMDEQAFLKEMTSDDFFRYCEICYDANDYFKPTEHLTSREKYRRMADGREGGLLEITGDSPQAFNDWYTGGAWVGGHPWEICRGGNSTHISLSTHKDQAGWKLYLAGSSSVRVVETAKMAIALFENNIPFILVQAQEILRMLQGIDDLGIVPENVLTTYCHSYFPKEDQIIDFINPWHDEEIAKVIREYAEWYPVATLTPAM
jgi:hypothetical protein